MAAPRKSPRKKASKKTTARRAPAPAVAIDTPSAEGDPPPDQEDTADQADENGEPMDPGEALDQRSEVIQILQALPPDVLVDVLMDSGYTPPVGVQLPDTEDGEDRPHDPQKELEEFWELVDGLPPGAQEAVAFTVYRVWPPRHPTMRHIKMVGHCGTYRHRMDVDDIRDDYGRGDYDITMSFGSENVGRYKSLVRSKRISIAHGPWIVPEDNPDESQERDGPSQKILDRLQELEERLADKKEQDRGDKILDNLLPLMIEKLAAPPPAPPPATDPIDSLGKLLTVMDRLHGKKPEDDPDSAAGRVRQLRELLHESGELFKTMRDPGPGETTQAETPRTEPGQGASNQGDDSDMMTEERGREILEETVEYHWTLLEANPNGQASKYAKEIRSFIAERAGDKWVETLIAEITVVRALQWLEQYAKNNSTRQGIMDRRRWRDKVEKTVGLLRGDISESDADRK